MKIFQFVTITLGLLSLVLSACGSTDVIAPLVTASPAESPQIEPATDTPMPSPASGKPTIPTSVEGIPTAILESAKNDLATHLGISEDQIQVAASREIVWPDASLGCPQPGMVYAQVTKPGYLIQLESTGKLYRYHADKGNTLILCDLIASERDKSLEDGWPNQPKDDVIIKLTPTKNP